MDATLQKRKELGVMSRLENHMKKYILISSLVLKTTEEENLYFLFHSKLYDFLEFTRDDYL
jgi:hypothetical protein